MNASEDWLRESSTLFIVPLSNKRFYRFNLSPRRERLQFCAPKSYPRRVSHGAVIVYNVARRWRAAGSRVSTLRREAIANLLARTLITLIITLLSKADRNTKEVYSTLNYVSIAPSHWSPINFP